jgi:hypothetical protein
MFNLRFEPADSSSSFHTQGPSFYLILRLLLPLAHLCSFSFSSASHIPL